MTDEMRHLDEIRFLNQREQIMLTCLYRNISKTCPLPAFREVEFSNMSQNGEDGLLLFLFSLIGTTNKVVIEICAGNGIECNAANLVTNHGWWGMLMDGNKSNIESCRRFYSNFRTTRSWPPVSLHAWITAENVNEIIQASGFNGGIDLLSLDIDGIDYWLWKSLNAVNPRAVILEFNHLWGPEASVSVPYKPDFTAEFTEYGSDYAGASLTAFVKLGREKGYRLIGTNSIATNAVFLRNDIGQDLFPEITTEKCFYHPRAKFGMEHRFLKIKDKPWIAV